jgi:hypothetical protein
LTVDRAERAVPRSVDMARDDRRTKVEPTSGQHNAWTSGRPVQA